VGKDVAAEQGDAAEEAGADDGASQLIPGVGQIEKGTQTYET